MKYYPILFSAPMVRAILDGRKTRTRRILKFSKDSVESEMQSQVLKGNFINFNLGSDFMPCPYGQPRDRIWVRETWARVCYDPYGTCDGTTCPYCRYEYKADAPKSKYPGDWPNGFQPHEVPVKWKPSIHMPRRASRITLEVLSIRVERLNDISEADAIAEGVQSFRPVPGDGPSETVYKNYLTGNFQCRNAIASFQTLWISINGPESWNKNPWVWVVEFKRIPQP